MSQSNLEIPGRPYFEDVLPKTGWGIYYKFMVVVACLSSFMHAATFLSLSFALPLSTCEHLISESILLAVYVSFVFGRATGTVILNPLCDIYGRKRFLSYSLLLIFLSSFTAAFAYNYYVVIFSASILAFGLESNHCVVRIHLAEILPKDSRGFYLSLCDVCWAVGYISLSLFAVLMKNTAVTETRAIDMSLATWRMIFAICGGMSITLACTNALLEESPRYFLHVKKYYLALLTLKQFYAINKSSYGETIEVREADLRNIVQDYGLSVYPEPMGCGHMCQKVTGIMFRSIALLVSKRFMACTILLLLIKTPLLIMRSLDVNIWLAKHLDVNSTVQEGMDFIYLDSMRDMSMCTNWMENRVLHYLYFLLASNVLFGKIIVMVFIDHLGRKLCAVISLMACGASFFCIRFINYLPAKIILSSILMTFFSSAATTVSIINVESYPTALRGTSWGIVNFFGIILSIPIVRYYHVLEPYFLLTFGWLFTGAAVVAVFVRDLKQKPMVE